MAIFMVILFSIVGLVVLYPFILWYLYINDKLMYRLIMKKTVAIISCMVLGILLFQYTQIDLLKVIALFLVLASLFFCIQVMIDLVGWLFDKAILGSVIMLSIVIGIGVLMFLPHK